MSSAISSTHNSGVLKLTCYQYQHLNAWPVQAPANDVSDNQLQNPVSSIDNISCQWFHIFIARYFHATSKCPQSSSNKTSRIGCLMVEVHITTVQYDRERILLLSTYYSKHKAPCV